MSTRTGPTITLCNNVITRSVHVHVQYVCVYCMYPTICFDQHYVLNILGNQDLDMGSCGENISRVLNVNVGILGHVDCGKTSLGELHWPSAWALPHDPKLSFVTFNASLNFHRAFTVPKLTNHFLAPCRLLSYAFSVHVYSSRSFHTFFHRVTWQGSAELSARNHFRSWFF
mgnify:CR=1 FL=1